MRRSGAPDISTAHPGMTGPDTRAESGDWSRPFHEEERSHHEPSSPRPPAHTVANPELQPCPALAACGGGGGGGSSTTSAGPASTSLSGTVDGYLKGATVFLDVNGSGSIDAGRPAPDRRCRPLRARYPASARRSAVSGHRHGRHRHRITGYAFTRQLAARADSATTGQRLISPLTSLPMRSSRRA